MTRYSMDSHKRKNHQRWFNKYCRYVNKIMDEDDLWLGRFQINQLRSEMNWFSDGSGGVMAVEIRMYDRKTGIAKTRWYTGLDMSWKFWYDFNNFIIEDCKVWEEKPDVRDNRIDFRTRR